MDNMDIEGAQKDGQENVMSAQQTEKMNKQEEKKKEREGNE